MSSSKTPLYQTHSRLGAKIVDFHGWLMPVQYTSIIEEHKAVREGVGVFDVSHMGEIEVKGEHALELLQRLTPNDVNELEDGHAHYTALLNDNGGFIDDMLVYAISRRRFFLCVNASNTAKDLNWLADNALQYPDVKVTNLTRHYGMLAIQGPSAEPLVKQLTDYPMSRLGHFQFTLANMGEHTVLLARTGYTGEDGFELFCEWRDTQAIWDRIMTRGKSFGIKPIGLGARDTLRMEMRYPLHGQDIDETTTPYEAGLDFMVKLGKQGGFVGRETLLKQKEEGVKRRLVGVEMAGRGIPRAGFKIFRGGEEIGRITSGAWSPTLEKAIGLGYINIGFAGAGTRVDVEIRGKMMEAEVRNKAFVSPHVKKSETAESGV